MDSEIEKQILVDRAIEEVIRPVPLKKELISIPGVRQKLADFNSQNGSDLTIWEIFTRTFTEKDNVITPIKPIETVIQVAQLTKQDQEYTLIHEELNDDFREAGWIKVKFAEIVIKTCEKLMKKFH